MKDLQLLKDQWLSQKKPIMLFTLLGLPASGKTYFAEMIEEILENFFSDISIFDIDEIRHTHFGYSFDPDKEQKVRDILMKNVVEEIKKNRNKKNKNNIKQRKTQKDSLLHPSLKIKNALIIIDDVNYYNSMRHEFYQICKEYRCLYVPIYIKCPLKVCLERNKQRGKPIPQDLIKDMFQKFDEPGEKYAWDESLFVFQSHTQKLIDKIPELIDKIMERLGLWK